MREQTRAHIFVSGRVQGVFFRQMSQEKAGELRLGGWVRNVPDGRVEILCEGEKEKVEEFLEWLKQGPPMAAVEHIDVQYREYRGQWADFSIT